MSFDCSLLLSDQSLKHCLYNVGPATENSQVKKKRHICKKALMIEFSFFLFIFYFYFFKPSHVFCGSSRIVTSLQMTTTHNKTAESQIVVSHSSRGALKLRLYLVAVLSVDHFKWTIEVNDYYGNLSHVSLQTVQPSLHEYVKCWGSKVWPCCSYGQETML